MDVRACLDAPLVAARGGIVTVPTGLAFEIPFGYEIQVRSRSGLARKNGIAVLNSPGTIDSDYRGELAVVLINLGTEPFTIHHGDRIAQLVCAPVLRVSLSETSSLSETDRGGGGFGSTGL
jgi:dUTP pyrophosphatase